MAEEGYSVFGLNPHRLRDILRPLVEQAVAMEGTSVGPDLREKFIYAQLIDAYLSAESLLLLTDAGLLGKPVGMGGIEVIVRRMIEQAIVVRYVHGARDDTVVERYLKSSAHEWERSWGVAPRDAVEMELPPKGLPKYKPMAIAAAPELVPVYAKLSYLSHPRGAYPYAELLRSSPLDPIPFFELQLAGICAWIDIAVRHLLHPYREDPGPSRL